MGVSCSCPLTSYIDFENGFQSVIIKSISFGEDDQKRPVRSISYKEHDLEPTMLMPLGLGKMMVEESISFKTREAEMMKRIPQMPILDVSQSPKHEAAIKLQKVYKSFRTRRKLADCAVLIEQSWWKLLDFAELKRSSISFFDLEKHESAISRWSRARTRAAKIDPRHRYGHNLHFYYIKWLNSQSKEPFFYWLDIGEGKEVNLVEKCPRSKLQQQCIKYLGPMERKAYEVSVENGKLFYKQTGELLDTTREPKGVKCIFVLSTSQTLYVGKKRKGTFQHSSFLAGGATSAAGRMVVENGTLKAVWPHSGHYRPTPENFEDFKSFLRENNVDLADVKLDSMGEEEEESNVTKSRVHLRTNSSEDDLVTEENYIENSTLDKVNSREDEAAMQILRSSTYHGFSQKLTNLQIPSKDDLLERLNCENKKAELNDDDFLLKSPVDGYKTAEEDEHDETKEETISEEAILQRINSHKEMKSYQLGKQLSCKWSTGAGPRIGCVRDYPSGLQSHALEQVNLSPRSDRCLRLDYPSGASTPEGSSLSLNGTCHSRMQPSPLCRGP
ncbi:calmodulin-binding family protein [Forsythia ovata]|uniref:Calmodulin-binding family protein n=1 Tax=Forsythia ovata TaxID=205694 RepID=A0ABD1X8D8_9LAMI